MRGFLACGAFAAAALVGGGAAAAPSVHIKDAVARVTVIPEDRADVKVEFLTTNAALPLVVRREGERTVVDGDLRHSRINNCTSLNGQTSVNVRGVGRVGWEDMPQVVVRTPREAKVAAGGAVFGTVGRSASLDLSHAGCGDWTIANVAGELKIREAGSGDVKAGSAASAQVSLAGSGDVSVGRIAGDLDADIAGSGDIRAQSIGGDLKARVAGSGDVRVAGGRAGVMEASIAGSGDVTFGGVAERLEARVMGSGDVTAARVTGAVSKSIMGSGAVHIGD